VKKQIPDFLEILKVLSKHKVDFIIVGGVCAVLHGAPVSTFDLDLVHSRSPANLTRLMASLEELGAYYRARAAQPLKPELPHLSSSGHQLLTTKLGPLDLLGTIGKGHDFEALLRYTVEQEISGLHLRLLDLEALIRIKKETITDKDKAIIPILEMTLKEKAKKASPCGIRSLNSE
jgi:predicted nucleotidyltransferase